MPPGVPRARPTGLIAPVRSARARDRSGALVLISFAGVPRCGVAVAARELLLPLATAAVRRVGRCDVVCDCGADAVRTVLGAVSGARVLRAAEVDVDALHAGAGVCLAAPALTALALAQARRAPLALLPPLSPDQGDLAERVRRSVPLPIVDDPEDPRLWPPPDIPGGEPRWAVEAGSPWDALDPAADDLRGAQRVARHVRQLSLAPIGG
ncbi:CGA synthase-related protein [Streptomyces sp. URMC 123]|uniref:CGA synthase-related protein n=1 Tax=Streptomyces sp. URMC 123 TaxID=3423403 RepID=UPI003F1BCC31